MSLKFVTTRASRSWTANRCRANASRVNNILITSPRQGHVAAAAKTVLRPPTGVAIRLLVVNATSIDDITISVCYFAQPPTIRRNNLIFTPEDSVTALRDLQLHLLSVSFCRRNLSLVILFQSRLPKGVIATTPLHQNRRYPRPRANTQKHGEAENVPRGHSEESP